MIDRFPKDIWKAYWLSASLVALDVSVKVLDTMPGGNLRWQARIRPAAGHRGCTPKMATPLDSTSMMKLVNLLAGLIVFPGWLEANPESGRQCEPQEGAVLRKRPAEPHNV